MITIRVMEYGVTSYWPKTLAQAEEMVQEILARNGCGIIQQRKRDGLWITTHRFERQYGLIRSY